MSTPTLVHSIACSSSVLAVTYLNSQLFVTRSSSDNIEVYDYQTFKLSTRLTLTVNGFGSTMHGLAACSATNCLYISDYDKKKIHRIHMSAKPPYTATGWSVDGYPIGLSVNRSRNILAVISQGSGKIQEYTSGGALVREIASDIGGNLWHAIELTNAPALAVSCCGSMHGVCVKSITGDTLHTYLSSIKGSRPGQMDTPRCLAVDDEGFILAADQINNRILVLDPTLTDSMVLPLSLKEPLHQPRAVCYDQSSRRLIIGEWKGQSRVLIFENVFNLSELYY